MRDPKHPRKLDEAFKRQIVELYDNGKPVSEIEKEYDLSHSTVNRWVRLIHESGSTRAADNRTPEEEELIRLRKENARLRMEVDFLKQAALIFAEDSRHQGQCRQVPYISAMRGPGRPAGDLLSGAQEP